mmetsp:Transcript_31950/g.58572  ORF Transcript_31950/g.58572 Transcript_31950/m.58572 type:complete len:180 (+) Transcript_31950:892-1431(+)
MAMTPAEFFESDTFFAARLLTKFEAETVTEARVATIDAEVMLAGINVQNVIPEAWAVVETRITRAEANAANFVAEAMRAEKDVEHAAAEAVAAAEAKVTRAQAEPAKLAATAKEEVEKATDAKFAAEARADAAEAAAAKAKADAAASEAAGKKHTNKLQPSIDSKLWAPTDVMNYRNLG